MLRSTKVIKCAQCSRHYCIVKCFVQLVSQSFGDDGGGTCCTKQFYSVTYPVTAKIVARQVSRKEELNSTLGNGSCNLSRNHFGCCRVCYTAKCCVKLVPPQCRHNIAIQVARNISQCNSGLRMLHEKR